jgi:hypothetical protein
VAAQEEPPTGPQRLDQAVKLSPEVRHRLRVAAAFLEVEISELVQEAITGHLNRLDQERRKRGLAPLPEVDAVG